VGGKGGNAKLFGGGTGGDGRALGGSGGFGGSGGSCCDHPGGKGAAGGKYGRAGGESSSGGAGGRGHPSGPDGTGTLNGMSRDGDFGPKGADCPATGGGGGVTYAGPLVNIAFYSSGGSPGTWYIDGDAYNPTASPISVVVKIEVDGHLFGAQATEIVPAKSGATNGHLFIERTGPLSSGRHTAKLFLDGKVAAVTSFTVP
jgi:hypothetical protein